MKALLRSENLSKKTREPFSFAHRENTACSTPVKIYARYSFGARRFHTRRKVPEVERQEEIAIVWDHTNVFHRLPSEVNTRIFIWFGRHFAL